MSGAGGLNRKLTTRNRRQSESNSFIIAIFSRPSITFDFFSRKERRLQPNAFETFFHLRFHSDLISIGASSISGRHRNYTKAFSSASAASAVFCPASPVCVRVHPKKKINSTAKNSLSSRVCFHVSRFIIIIASEQNLKQKSIKKRSASLRVYFHYYLLCIKCPEPARSDALLSSTFRATFCPRVLLRPLQK